MNQQSERGFTIIEIMLAVIVLSVGVMALVGSSALATRMVGRGAKTSQVTQVAMARAELLRAYAAQTSPGCTNANVKTDSTITNGVGEKWQLLGSAGDPTRDVRMMFSYRVPRGTRTDTMMITLYCK
jgi:prepilin-type N-terminal cleavage/methylation domain-containing protein